MRNMFSVDSKVYFKFDGKEHTGKVFVVDFWNGEAADAFGLKGAGHTYDILVESENTLYKHIPEHSLSSVQSEYGGGREV
ncbi:MAG: hypothetical protein LBK75_03180 [Oscillospiraceae bacterium]|jgi:hypothetical protein|nr:hypothetical protein [Oscillospiraceae bacterium]